jgi:methylenetetrahydrofolate dehydrogenase (NADP+)/methenyltetrahydrofolate cyclohydrolase
MMIIDGKQTAAVIRAELAAEVKTLVPKTGRAPGLAVVLVGEDPASQVYVRMKTRACAEVGVVSTQHLPPAGTPFAELKALISRLNDDKGVDGILVQLPLPRGYPTQEILDLVDPDKDVDGFHPENVGRLALGLPGFAPCTPAGCLELLKRHNLPTRGARAVVVGRSNIVGKPLSIMLGLPGEYGDATVTLCHSKTPDLAAETRRADFLFPAIGRPKLITAGMVKDGAVVVDVGINRTEAGLVGDVDFAAVKDKCRAITPVPGGVGPMTIAMLMTNTVLAYKRRTGLTGT